MNNIPIEAQSCGPHAAPTGRLRFVIRMAPDKIVPLRILQQEWEGRHGKAWADVPFEENP